MKRTLRFGAPLLFIWSLSTVPLDGQISGESFGAMRARSIGPAGMGGRISAIDAVAVDPNIVYVGTATGGVWKSTNGGQTWMAVFDRQPVLGIGAITINQSNPDVVWVGTGEGNPRSDAGVGGGVFRSVDGGVTWRFLGLAGSERIHRILLHPHDPDVAYVGAMGPAWSDGTERGVYKTVDGGDSWQQVLFVDVRTGVSDMVMDGSNPDKIIVGMWSFRRSPWFFESGGSGSGLYVTEDGGLTWRVSGPSDGLPEGDLGRIGLTLHQGDRSTVYALVEAERSALLRSEDGGRRWSTVREGPDANPRPFYFSDLVVDPGDASSVYQLHSGIERSEDGGRTFQDVGRGVHPNFHAVWVNPENPRHLYAGTDGGLYVTQDRGAHWRMIDNLPIAQFNHVSVDLAVPYSIYGGMQGNGSWKGPSDVWEAGGIRNHHWNEIASGDGSGTLVDPELPGIGYAMAGGGHLMRFDERTGERKQIRPWAPDSTALRFNWNAPIAADPYVSGGLYYGSQLVHKSMNRGDSWQIISADLTTNNRGKQQRESGGLTVDNTGEERHTTIVTIAPSALSRDVIWVGTDDGRVQVTSSGGGQWYDVTRAVKGPPDSTWVAHIEASKFDPAAAFVVFDDHRRGNWEPYVYRTNDYGGSWDRIADRNDLEGFVHTIEQDPVVRDLFFAGTEFGLFVTLNGGEDWFRWNHGLPAVPVRSLVVHPRDHDLVVGTHGRGIYVLDDVRPLRELARDPRLAEQGLYVFEPFPAFMRTMAPADGSPFGADAVYEGEPRPYGAVLSYWLGDSEAEEPVVIEILDFEDRVVRTLEGTRAPGLNRVVWDLRETLPEALSGSRATDRPVAVKGLEALPGLYTVRVTRGVLEFREQVEILPDPRVDLDLESRVAKYQALRRAQAMEVRIARMRQAVTQVREAVDGALQRLRSDGGTSAAELIETGQSILVALGEVRDSQAVEKYRSGVSGLSSSYDKPTEGQRIDLIRMEEVLSRLTERLDGILLLDVPRFRSQLQATGIDGFPSEEAFADIVYELNPTPREQD